MAKIENIIKDNRSVFFAEAPPVGHFKRFQDRFYTENSTLRPLLKVAAIFIAALLLAGTYFFLNTSTQAPYGSMSEEFQETEYYYKSMVNNKLERVENILNSQQFQSIKRELKAMDENYLYLKADYKLNPEDQRIRHAMIHHYQLKIEFLQKVIDQVQHFKTSNNYHYETQQG